MTESDHNTGTNWGTRWQVLLRFIVILGIIVLLFFISIGIVRFVPKLFGGASVYLSSLFGGKPLETSIDKKEVRSGESFYLNWKNNTKDKEGQYTFSYKCTDGVKIEYQSVNGLKPVVCNTLFPLPNDLNSYPFAASSTNKNSVSVPYSINLWDKTTNKSKLSASGNIVMIPKDAPYSDAVANPGQTAAVNLYQSGSQSGNSSNSSSNNSSINSYNDATTTATYPLGGFGNSNSTTATSSSSGGSKTTTGSTYTKTYGSSPNLGISLVKVGYVDSRTNYYNTTSIPENARVLVQFNVFNIGDAPTGNWTLTANLPTKISYERVFNSGSQPSIAPGNSFEMTLAFDSFDPSISAITLSVSSNGDVGSANNYLSIPLTNGGYNGGNGGGYNSGDADLVVHITGVNMLSSNYYGNYGYYGDRVVVNFEVQNIGGESTGSWNFRADIPNADDDTYDSPWQNSLAPGQKMQFTLGFDVSSFNNSDYVRITVDNEDNVDEQNENNNSDSARI